MAKETVRISTNFLMHISFELYPPPFVFINYITTYCITKNQANVIIIVDYDFFFKNLL